jgi:hypothetical protein
MVVDEEHGPCHVSIVARRAAAPRGAPSRITGFGDTGARWLEAHPISAAQGVVPSTTSCGGQGARYVGCSNYAVWHLGKALWTDKRHLTPFLSSQVHHSFQTRDIENEILPLVIDQGVGVRVCCTDS